MKKVRKNECKYKAYFLVLYYCFKFWVLHYCFHILVLHYHLHIFCQTWYILCKSLPPYIIFLNLTDLFSVTTQHNAAGLVVDLKSNREWGLKSDRERERVQVDLEASEYAGHT